QKANLKDIQKELRQLGVPYRHETLFEIYSRASDEYEPLSAHEALDYELMIDVSKDGLNAWMTVIPPDRGDARLTPEKVKEALETAQVEKGIMYDQIKRILASGEAQERVLIAQGVANEHGADGTITFTDKATDRFAMGDDTADYKELSLIDNVLEGELVATITHPTKGENGFNIQAKVLKGRPGKKAKYRMGKNVRLSEDGTELFATKDGYVVRTGLRVSVENVLEVNNVNAETGNLRFHGVVKVRGQVEDAFVIDADKGIEVAGTVGKAKLISRGDISIRGGVFGAELESEGNLEAAFLSDVTVRAGGHVLVRDYILHSDVESRKSVKIINESEGFIHGGRVRAETLIRTPIAGNEVGEDPTRLEVGGGVNVRNRYDLLDEKMDHHLEVYEKLRKNLQYLQNQREREGIPTEARKQELYATMTGSGRKTTQNILALSRTHHELLQAMANPEEGVGVILISQIAHPGTSIQIQTGRVTLKEPMESCGFAILNENIKAMPFGTALNLHKHQETDGETP
ncbi:MAG: FapA family protein, partial [bacterium]